MCSAEMLSRLLATRAIDLILRTSRTSRSELIAKARGWPCGILSPRLAGRDARRAERGKRDSRRRRPRLWSIHQTDLQCDSLPDRFELLKYLVDGEAHHVEPLPGHPTATNPVMFSLSRLGVVVPNNFNDEASVSRLSSNRSPQWCAFGAQHVPPLSALRASLPV